MKNACIKKSWFFEIYPLILDVWLPLNIYVFHLWKILYDLVLLVNNMSLRGKSTFMSICDGSRPSIFSRETKVLSRWGKKWMRGFDFLPFLLWCSFLKYFSPSVTSLGVYTFIFPTNENVKIGERKLGWWKYLIRMWNTSRVILFSWRYKSICPFSRRFFLQWRPFQSWTQCYFFRHQLAIIGKNLALTCRAAESRDKRENPVTSCHETNYF